MDNSTERIRVSKGKAGEAAKTQIEWIAVDKLIISSKNPRKVFDDEFQALKASIEKDPEFLKRRPILVVKQNGKYVIYGGTQRYKACVELGHKEVPVLIQDGLQAKTVDYRMLSDNQHFGEWDEAKLLGEFTEEMQQLIVNEKNLGEKTGTKAPSIKPATIPIIKLNFDTKEDRDVFFNLLQYLHPRQPHLSIADRVKDFLVQNLE